MAKSAASTSGDFRTRLRSLEYTRNKLHKLFLTGQITRRDIEQVYQGLFLEAVAAFESHIELFFIGLLSKSIDPHSRLTVSKANARCC